MPGKKYQLLILLKLTIAITLIAVIIGRVNLDDVWSAFVRADKC